MPLRPPHFWFVSLPPVWSIILHSGFITLLFSAAAVIVLVVIDLLCWSGWKETIFSYKNDLFCFMLPGRSESPAPMLWATLNRTVAEWLAQPIHCSGCGCALLVHALPQQLHENKTQIQEILLTLITWSRRSEQSGNEASQAPGHSYFPSNATSAFLLQEACCVWTRWCWPEPSCCIRLHHRKWCHMMQC